MADKDAKLPENAAGPFYVDDQCIDCDACRETASDFFRRNDDKGYSYVYRQPTSEADRELCLEAMEGCPVEAIGEDGGPAPESPLEGAKETAAEPTAESKTDG